MILLIYPMILTISTSLIIRLTENIFLQIIFLIVVGLLLYFFKALIYKEIDVKNALYTMFFVMLKSIIVAFGIAIIVSFTLTGRKDVVDFVWENRTMIIYFDVANAYGFCYGLAALFSFLFSEGLARKLGINGKKIPITKNTGGNREKYPMRRVS